MNKKIASEIAIGIIIILAIIVGGIFYWQGRKNNQQSVVNKQQPATNNQQIQPVDENANWQTYTNEKYGFTLQVPQGFKWNIDDQSFTGLYYVTFSNDKLADTSIDLNINTNDWVAKIKNLNQELRDYADGLLSGPHIVNSKVINWAEDKTKDNQAIYFYTVETTLYNNTKFQTSGSFLLSKGTLFEFRNVGKAYDQQLLRNIALSFTTK